MSKASVASVNRSGFPLQIAAENEIRRVGTGAGWEVLYSEHGWSSLMDGSSGFIDLVVRHKHDNCVLVIECKRVLDTAWTFLCPSEKQMRRRQCKSWVTSNRADKVGAFGWYNVAIDPPSPESEFCAVRGEAKNDRPMLERIASEVVLATEALAFEQKDRLPEEFGSTKMYFNVILTTAQLEVCQFDVSEISLANGKVPDNSKISDVQFVRFRKQLSIVQQGMQPKIDDAKTLTDAKENTVLIVNARHLGQFLTEFEVDRTSFQAFA